MCVYGAGSIGGLLGVKLARAGHAVSLVARGTQLEAIRARGLTLITKDDAIIGEIPATDDPGELGPQDYVIIALKAHSMTSIAERIGPLLGERTAVVTAQNGIPWWYFYELEGPWKGHRLEIADPGGKLWDQIGPERVIGCVVYPSCEIVEPGVVRHLHGNRIMLGEPDGSESERVLTLSRTLTGAGFKAPVRTRIRDDIWLKLWGNLSFNPVSVLAVATLEDMTRHTPTLNVIRGMMLEAEAVATKLGVRFAVDVDKRIRWGADVGAHKPSMLQDLERGRPLEIDALVGAVSELGRLVGVPTPTIDTVLALVSLRGVAATT